MTKNKAKPKVIMVKSIKDIKGGPGVIHESHFTSPVNVLKPLSIQAKMQRKRKRASWTDTSLVADMQQRLKTIVKSDNLAETIQQKWKTIGLTATNKPEKAKESPDRKCNIKPVKLAPESKWENTTEQGKYPSKRNLPKNQGKGKHQMQPIKSESVDDYLESIQKLQSALDGSAHTSQFPNDAFLSDVEEDIERARTCESSQLPIVLNGSLQMESSTEITDEDSSSSSKRIRIL